MTRSYRKCITLVFFLLLALLIAAPLALTWRVVRQERLNSALFTAIERNDTRQALMLLRQGADPNARRATDDKAPSTWHLLLLTLRGKHDVPPQRDTALMHG